MTASVRMAGPGDEHLFSDVAAGVFDGPIRPARLREFLHDPRHHLAVALDGSKVVGMASAVDYVHPDKDPELWINEVGVSPTHRSRGLGRRLLEELLEHGRSRGCRQAWVLTDRGNDAARALYRSAGGDAGHGDVVAYEFVLG